LRSHLCRLRSMCFRVTKKPVLLPKVVRCKASRDPSERSHATKEPRQRGNLPGGTQQAKAPIAVGVSEIVTEQAVDATSIRGVAFHETAAAQGAELFVRNVGGSGPRNMVHRMERRGEGGMGCHRKKKGPSIRMKLSDGHPEAVLQCLRDMTSLAPFSGGCV